MTADIIVVHKSEFGWLIELMLIAAGTGIVSAVVARGLFGQGKSALALWAVLWAASVAGVIVLQNNFAHEQLRLEDEAQRKLSGLPPAGAVITPAAARPAATPPPKPGDWMWQQQTALDRPASRYER